MPQTDLETYSDQIWTNTLVLKKHIFVPYILWSSCRTEFPFLEAQKDAEGRTGSPGHWAAWEDEEPGEVKQTNVMP